MLTEDIDYGRVIAAGTRGELKNSVGSAGIRIRLLDPAHRDRARDLIAGHQIVVHDEPDPAVLSARIPAQQRAWTAGEPTARALGRLTGAGIGVSDFALGQPGLDEVFLALTSRQATAAQPGQAHSAPTFMSNIFVNPATMPGWLRGVSDVNPVSHLVTATRTLMAGTATTPQVLWAVAAAGLLITVFAPLTALLYQRK